MKALVHNTHDCRTEREIEFNTIEDLLKFQDEQGNKLIIERAGIGTQAHIDFTVEIYDYYRE